ncbi:MAG: ATP-binding protein, partial [Saprospiraceae bacterium]|nr:ATP-binding protein [Saprospiraceae bacterium]
MDQHFKKVRDLITQSASIGDERKEDLLRSLKKVEGELEILRFKLDRTEKVKQTITVLLDETIAELNEKHRKLEIEAALDRVRAKIASMRNPADLERITPLVWQELSTMSVPFFRCGVLIINDTEKKWDVYLSTPEGQSLAAMMIPHGTFEFMDEAADRWSRGEILTLEWDKSEFVTWTASLIQKGMIKDQERYSAGDEAPEKLALHFIPFSSGMLYVGSENILEEEHLTLVKALADTFSVAYARYEDFIRLEKAKVEIEHTLSNLRTAQAQLVQSEKMASLGELTAGIAHEIQNPLNFVNNFSEVSIELIEDMEDELRNGNPSEVMELGHDLKQNLEKIAHHGERASAIVKSMLLHSRADSGKEEKVDINALVDEYLRLAFHGMRAKDKSFNASMNTDFDETLEEIEVIPQEIGRVLLNLITNAFHAVNEKKTTADDGYVPEVLVSTKKSEGKLQITVKDNGPGIPDSIKDKIFQPFFTTKPTGEGTGLGLSLSYDIVKAHGG